MLKTYNYLQPEKRILSSSKNIIRTKIEFYNDWLYI